MNHIGSSNQTSNQTWMRRRLGILISALIRCALWMAVAVIGVSLLASVASAQELSRDSSGSNQISMGESMPTAGGTLGKGGHLSDQEMQQLCKGAAAKHMNPGDVQSLGQALGLSTDQIVQLNSCIAQAQQSGQPSSEDESEQAAKSPQQIVPSSGATEVSSIENRFRELDTPYKLFSAPVTKSLNQFGYELFSSRVSTFAPVGNVPVADDYMLGPGDELNVYTWGRVNQTAHLKIERDGTVVLPQLGPVPVAGLSFGQAKKMIEGRVGQITGVHVDVTMGRVRTMQVFVIGKVSQPGLFTISALSSVSNALVAAGGISKMGSLRRIELRRDNRVLRQIDLYDLLLRGDTSADVRLEPRDVIFVPVIGPVVAITGDVKSPAIYETRGNESLGDLIRMAGGVTAFGYSERIQVERVEHHQKRVALDVDLNRASAGRFPIQDGDLVKVFTVLPTERNVVQVKGNVNQPGTYEWHPGMKVSDLVRAAQGPADHTFFGYAMLQRREGKQRALNPIPVNLDGALTGLASTDNLGLQPEDVLTVYSQNEIAEVPTVSVLGKVRKPGKYPLLPGMTVRELIYGAGGLMDSAALDKAQLTRTEISTGAVAHYSHLDIDLRPVLDSSDRTIQMALKPGDELLIQEASNWHIPWHVTLQGEVMRSGPYSIHEGERLSSLLQDGGGFRADAYPRAAVFIRKSVKDMQEQELAQARTRLQQDLARVALMPKQSGDADRSVESLAAIKEVLTQTEGQQAMGRVVVHLGNIQQLQGSSSDLVLENDDTLIIPKKPASVQVLGQVYNPNAIVYQPSLRVSDYLQQAGGATEGGDIEHIYVIKADGSVLTDRGVRDSNKNRLFPILPAISGGLEGQRLEPGDTIYVPEKLIYVNRTQYVRDITQIIANSALSLATIGVLATNL
jgi:protein involved in polysaccharide export with SLBB domain